MATKKKIKRNILNYTAIFSRENNGGYSVKVLRLPGCFSQGDTFREAFKNIKEAVELYDAKEERQTPRNKKFERIDEMISARMRFINK